ncbi:amino acid adenylation domain-containing protein [Brenneria sp. g21c3]|uniref:amino acid adenylation domain-containing protein n=1 Tax=Brenneria sp. g21c3 TaxID=3093893 RepID=UPI002EBFD985|nr:amino acid adenylation domain-containing protein [Brenneria sp. g21c3]
MFNYPKNKSASNNASLPKAQLARRNPGNGIHKKYDSRPLYRQLAERLAQPNQSGKAAVIAGDGQLDYQTLYEQSSRLGWHLSRQFKPGAPQAIIAILLPKSRLQIVSVWGVLASGAAYLPLDIEQPAERLRTILSDARPAVVIVDGSTRHRLNDVAGVSLLDLDEQRALITEGAVPAAPDLPGYRSAEDDLVYVIYTSGTTGIPKGVMIESRGVLNAIDYSRRVLFGAIDNLVIMGVSALHHDMSVFDVLGGMVSGGLLVLPDEAERKNPEAWSTLINEHRVNSWVSVPAMMEMLLTWSDHKKYHFASLQVVLLGGDWIPLTLAERVRGASSEQTALYSVGGPTETTMWNIAQAITEEEGWSSVPYGRPIANCTYRILNASLEDVPDWAVGEMYCGGISLARGYLNDEARTQARFITHPESGERLYRTGDLGFYHPDGRIEFVGRQDGQLKVRGNRVEAGEVRARLETWPEISRALVYLYEGSLTAALLLYPGQARLNNDELYRRAKAELSAAMVPGIWLQLYALPLTTNAKVDMQALLEKTRRFISTGDTAEEQGNGIRPLSRIESRLAGLWGELLGQRPENPDDNFFALGGDSLLLIRLLAKIQKTFDVTVSLPDLLTHLKIHEQADILKDKELNPNLDLIVRPDISDEDLIPLSFSQKGLWFQIELDASCAKGKYNIPLCFSIRGELDTVKFEYAVSQVINRHRLFGCNIVPDEWGGGDVFVKSNSNAVYLQFSDLSHFPLGIKKKKLINIANIEYERSIDLQKTPLVYLHLARLSGEEHYFYMTIHHIIFDGVSCDVFIRELMDVYTDKPLSPLTLDYLDYAKWVNSSTYKENLIPGLDYWQSRMNGFEPLELPYLAPNSNDAINGSIFHQFSDQDVQRLKELAKKHSTTLFTVFSVVLQIVLARFRTNGDVVFGTYVSNRVHDEFSHTIGYFINALPLRFDFDIDRSIAETISDSHKQIIQDFSWQHIPFEAVVERCNPAREAGQHPFFDVALIFNDNVLEREYQQDNICIKLEAGSDRGMRSHRTDIEFWVYPVENSLLCEVNYEKNKVGDRLALAISDTFQYLLTTIYSINSSTPLRTLSLFPDGYRPSVINGPTVSFENIPISELFDKKVQACPDEIIFTDQGINYSYADLACYSNSLAYELIREGVRPKDRVSILVPYSISLVISALAVLKAGGTLLLLDTSDSRERIGELIEKSQSRLVLAKEGYLPPNGRVFLIDKVDTSIITRHFASLETELIYLTYTSGSTGTSKAVEGHRFGLLNRIYWIGKIYPNNKKDKCILKTSVSFVDIYAELFTPLIMGVPSIIADDDTRKDPRKLIDFIRTNNVTNVTLTPTFLSEICGELERDKTLLPELRLIFSSGEILSFSLSLRVNKYIPMARLINIYGSSEMSADITTYEVKGDEIGLIPVGTLFSNTFARVVNQDGIILPYGFIGEIYVGGAILTNGYAISSIEQQQNFFEEGDRRWFKTGDVGFINQFGDLVILGRTDDQIKIRGVRIDLRAIDDVVLSCEGVISACSASVMTHRGDKVLGILIVTNKNMTADHIYNQLRFKLPRSSMPSILLKADSIPKLQGGKVNRKAVSKELADHYSSMESRDFIMPKTTLEKNIESVWQELLEIDTGISRDQNFFMLGGHSILATRLQNRLRTYFKVELSLVDIFNRPTIAEQAELIQSLPSTLDANWVSIGRTGYHSLSDNQLGTWYISKISRNHNLSNNLGMMYLVMGDINPQRLQNALNRLAERHEVFRTSFSIVDNIPKKMINSYGLINLEYKMCDDVMESSVIEYNRLIGNEFDLTTPPLIKIMLLDSKVQSPNNHEVKQILILSAHHIILDGWSLRVFFRDLNKLYNDVELEPLAFQGIDYVDLMNNSSILKEEFQRLSEFWHSHLEGIPQCLDLPLDNEREKNIDLSGSTICADLDNNLFQDVNKLAIERKVGKYHVFVSAFMMTLSYWCNQTDILVGGGISGRYDKKLDDVIDFFSDILPLRGMVNLDESLADNFDRLILSISESIKHQKFSFNKIVQQINHPRTPFYHPVVQVICTHQNLTDDVDFGDVPLEIFIPNNHLKKKVRFDISMFLFEYKRSMKLVVDYSDRLFTKKSIDALLYSYIQVLKAIINTPEKKLSVLPLFQSVNLLKKDNSNDDQSSESQLLEVNVKERTGMDRLALQKNRKEILNLLIKGMQDILQRKVRTDISMFEQGGNSMSIIAYQIYIQKNLSIDIDIGILIGYPTIDLLVDYIFEELKLTDD